MNELEIGEQNAPQFKICLIVREGDVRMCVWGSVGKTSVKVVNEAWKLGLGFFRPLELGKKDCDARINQPIKRHLCPCMYVRMATTERLSL